MEKPAMNPVSSVLTNQNGKYSFFIVRPKLRKTVGSPGRQEEI
jgi:hypothetical protein